MSCSAHALLRAHQLPAPYCGNPAIVEPPSNKRPKGRPKRRWKDCVDEDFANLKVKNLRLIAGIRAEWVKLLNMAQAHKGLSCQC
ncbi:hypothetical protein TNCV_1266261 [Trichonephila clavipes]|nr:hypothetical protein TNCV_1266261 [Trichonephila clavipes]